MLLRRMMKGLSILLACSCILLALDPGSLEAGWGWGRGKIVIANRASGDISVIDVRTDEVIKTVALPAFSGDAVPEPMYVVNTPIRNRVWVGDRANDRVVVFRGRNFAVEATIPCGSGVFHLAADQAGHQMWVVNDIDRTATVIDARKLEVITTVPMPADLGPPHDVVVDPRGVFAYITFLQDDTVVQYETVGFSEVDRAVVGVSPHAGYVRRNDELFVPCQGSDAVFVLDAINLDILDIIPVPNAHGTITSTNSRQFYTTNISDLGVNAIQCIDTRRNAVVGVADTPDPVPHNVALTRNGKKLYVTHSGATATTVSVFATRRNGNPRFLKTVVVGTNPFGLAYVR